MSADTVSLWREHKARLRSYIARRVRPPEAVDDVLQEVFMKAHAALPTLRPGGHVAAWLFRIAANAIVDHHRAQAPWLATDELPDELPHPPSAHDPMRELAMAIEPLLAALPSPYREAVQMADIDGLPQAEIAQRMGVSLSGAKSRVQRGREKLRALLHECCEIEHGPNGVVGYTPREVDCACGLSHTELLRLLDAYTVSQGTAP